MKKIALLVITTCFLHLPAAQQQAARPAPLTIGQARLNAMRACVQAAAASIPAASTSTARPALPSSNTVSTQVSSQPSSSQPR